MKIIDIIAQLQSSGRMQIREPKRYSFGDYNYCKQLFITAIKAYDKTITDLVWLPEYEEIVKWMVENKGKGLALVGSNGRGKTSIMFGVLPVAFHLLKKVFKPKLAISIKPQDMESIENSWAIALDDVGQEQIINNFGTKVDAVEKLISLCEQQLKPLFITTNLNQIQIQKRYGVRIMDRINRLCKIVEFSGPSLRK